MIQWVWAVQPHYTPKVTSLFANFIHKQTILDTFRERWKGAGGVLDVGISFLVCSPKDFTRKMATRGRVCPHLVGFLGKLVC